jgi:hypothetical protein
MKQKYRITEYSRHLPTVPYTSLENLDPQTYCSCCEYSYYFPHRETGITKSILRLATGWRVGVRTKLEARYSRPIQKGHEAHPASQIGTVVHPRE